MTPEAIRRIVRSSALYDLIVTAGFALPWTATAALTSIVNVHRGLGLHGDLPVLDDPYTLLFANLLGSIVVVWSVVRLLRPEPLLGAADTVGRLLFSTWFAWALAHGASPVLVGFLALEVAWGLLQGVAVSGYVTAALRSRRRRTLAPC
ncbi:hypothetical protein ABIE44_000699 [Marmoricola sp. OAE513]|uniref:hypothetical protein n=1 Tax=Marmoricola sp. OAE513 TaxID=2817894 RepID=UPI001AE96D8E